MKKAKWFLFAVLVLGLMVAGAQAAEKGKMLGAVGNFNDRPIPSRTYWGHFDGNIDLVLIGDLASTPAAAGKLWKGRPQVVVYNHAGGELNAHPGFVQALQHAQAIRDGKVGGPCQTDNCFAQTFGR